MASKTRSSFDPTLAQFFKNQTTLGAIFARIFREFAQIFRDCALRKGFHRLRTDF